MINFDRDRTQFTSVTLLPLSKKWRISAFSFMCSWYLCRKVASLSSIRPEVSPLLSTRESMTFSEQWKFSTALILHCNTLVRSTTDLFKHSMFSHRGGQYHAHVLQKGAFASCPWGIHRQGSGSSQSLHSARCDFQEDLG